MNASWKRRFWREPDGGNLHVRFDEGEGSGGHWSPDLSSRALLSTLLNLPEGRFDLIRTGLLPLGVKPAGPADCPAPFEPVMRVKARVAVLRRLEGGESFGYGRSYRAPATRTIAVLPLGYGDGYPRLENQGAVLIRGRRAPVVGTVTMDALAVDVTEVPGVAVGDEAVLLGDQRPERISPDELAGWAGTVVHEVLSGWRSRLPRRYLDEGASA